MECVVLKKCISAKNYNIKLVKFNRYWWVREAGSCSVSTAGSCLCRQVVELTAEFLPFIDLHHYTHTSSSKWNINSIASPALCTCACVFILPAYLWSWALTVSFAESPNSAITGSAQSGWTGIVRALKIKFTPTCARTHSVLCVMKWSSILLSAFRP